MALSNDQKLKIEILLKQNLRNKFKNYNPEPASMPFHTRLLGNDRMALFSFIHSLNTNFGSNIFEPVAKEIALNNFCYALSQQTAGYQISSKAHEVIQKIMDDLSTAHSTPDKNGEIEEIRKVAQLGIMHPVKLTKVDIKLVSENDTIYLIDLKTAKPNAGSFKEYKRTLLEWVAAALAVSPDANINTLIAIPYNPYEPRPYSRWTMRGMIDLDNELKVAEEFWDFLGGDNTYEQLLDIFEYVGEQLHPEIDEYFQKFNKS